MSRAQAVSFNRAALRAAALLAVLAAGCGDDEAPPGVGIGDGMDSGMDGGRDAMMPPLPDGRVPDPPKEAGTDAEIDARVPPQPTDEDAETPTCAEDCSALTTECVTAVCNEDTLECELTAQPDGTACGDRVTTDCSAKDSCESGVCAKHHVAEGQPCGDQGDACKRDDECNDNGECVDSGLRAVGTPCGDRVTDTECDAADTCDALGECSDNLAPLDAPCGDQDEPCHNDDACNGSGACIDHGLWEANECPVGVAESPRGDGRCVCGNPDAPLTECRPGPDVCNDAGACIPGEVFYGGEEGTDGLPCGDQTDDTCNDPDTCFGGDCLTNVEEIGTPCGDRSTNTVCDGLDSCNAFGQCDDHLADVNTTCGDAPGACFNEPLCNGSGTCLAATGATPGTMCGSQSTSDCDGADVCDGFGGCDDSWAEAATECGPEVSGICDAPDQCNATGTCIERFADTDTVCGDETECSNAQTCDGAGECEPDPKPAGEPCAGEFNDCQNGAECDGDGACAPNYEPELTECGDPAITCEIQDSCDAAGQCVDRGSVQGCGLETTIVVEREALVGDDQPGADLLIEVIGSDPLESGTTDSNGEVILTLPVGEPVLLRIHPSANTWGHVERVMGSTDDPIMGFEVLDDALFADIVAAPGLAPLDTARGALRVDFRDITSNGGESAGISPGCASATCGPVVLVDGEPVIDDELAANGDEMFYVSLDAGDYAISPEGVGGTNTCTLAGTNPWPVFEHTLTRARVNCALD